MSKPISAGTTEVSFTGSGGAVSPRTHNITVPSDAECVIYSVHNGYPTDISVVSITYGGQAMTALSQQFNTVGATGAGITTFYIKTGQTGWGTGAKAVVITFSDGGGANIAGMAQYWKNIDASSTFGTPSKIADAVSPATRTIVTDSNAVVIDFFSKRMSASGETITKDASQTANGRQDTGNGFLECQAGTSYKDGAASVDMSWTMSSTVSGWSYIAVALNGPSVVPPTPGFTPTVNLHDVSIVSTAVAGTNPITSTTYDYDHGGANSSPGDASTSHTYPSDQLGAHTIRQTVVASDSTVTADHSITTKTRRAVVIQTIGGYGVSGTIDTTDS